MCAADSPSLVCVGMVRVWLRVVQRHADPRAVGRPAVRHQLPRLAAGVAHVVDRLPQPGVALPRRKIGGVVGAEQLHQVAGRLLAQRLVRRAVVADVAHAVLKVSRSVLGGRRVLDWAHQARLVGDVRLVASDLARYARHCACLEALAERAQARAPGPDDELRHRRPEPHAEEAQVGERRVHDVTVGVTDVGKLDRETARGEGGVGDIGQGEGDVVDAAAEGGAADGGGDVEPQLVLVVVSASTGELQRGRDDCDLDEARPAFAPRDRGGAASARSGRTRGRYFTTCRDSTVVLSGPEGAIGRREFGASGAHGFTTAAVLVVVVPLCARHRPPRRRPVPRLGGAAVKLAAQPLVVADRAGHARRVHDGALEAEAAQRAVQAPAARTVPRSEWCTAHGMHWELCTVRGSVRHCSEPRPGWYLPAGQSGHSG